ncbi:hypothetical protein [Nocardioides mangrovi]|uniref:DUF5134 domain-containing protein n=1 Tax=Nocardioides mangrovi TaxID=2874580 RepID=A0ABS7UEE3_9ACTN|nr:hypothetical protein [Nocardioides mangrovi]MBZ5739375.1 hypothetical protein [Nocardioides mangrovi]
MYSLDPIVRRGGVAVLLMGAAMVVGCAVHLVLVARSHDWHPLHVACPALVLLAMVDTCLLGSGLLPGAVWAALVALAAVAAGVFAPSGRRAGHSWGVVAALVALLALPSAASATPAEDGAADLHGMHDAAGMSDMSGMTGMTGMSGMHDMAGSHAAADVPGWLWWGVLAGVVVIVTVLAVRVVRASGHRARSRRVLALAGLVEVGLMAAMVLPATA